MNFEKRYGMPCNTLVAPYISKKEARAAGGVEEAFQQRKQWHREYVAPTNMLACACPRNCVHSAWRFQEPTSFHFAPSTA